MLIYADLESCTLAISMVNSFPPEILVTDPDAYPASDVGTWGDISTGALSVQQLCLMDRTKSGMPKWTGWSQVGMFVMFYLSCFVVDGFFVGILMMGMTADRGCIYQE